MSIEPILTRAPAGAPELTVVIPAFNEQHRLPATLARVCGYLRAAGVGWEVIVVDDGSTDQTPAVVRGLARAEPRVRLISAPHRGKGHAVGLGVLGSTGRQILLCDADLSTPIEELAVLQSALGRAGVAIGSRAGHRAEVLAHPVRAQLGRMGNALIRAVAVPGVRDTQCGFKLFDGRRARAVFRGCRIDGWAFDIEVLRQFTRRGWVIQEVPVRWVHQRGSKVRPADYVWATRDLIRIRLDRR